MSTSRKMDVRPGAVVLPWNKECYWRINFEIEPCPRPFRHAFSLYSTSLRAQRIPPSRCPFGKTPSTLPFRLSLETHGPHRGRGLVFFNAHILIQDHSPQPHPQRKTANNSSCSPSFFLSSISISFHPSRGPCPVSLLPRSLYLSQTLRDCLPQASPSRKPSPPPPTTSSPFCHQLDPSSPSLLEPPPQRDFAHLIRSSEDLWLLLIFIL